MSEGTRETDTWGGQTEREEGEGRERHRERGREREREREREIASTSHGVWSGVLQVLLKTALRSGGLEAADVGYVAVHGTGTPLGDPIEVGALSGALSHWTGPDAGSHSGVILGSVKVSASSFLVAGRGFDSLTCPQKCRGHIFLVVQRCMTEINTSVTFHIM